MDRTTSQGLAVVGEAGGDPAVLLAEGVPTADSVDAALARYARAVIEAEQAKTAAQQMLAAYGDVTAIMAAKDAAEQAAQQAIINIASQAEDLQVQESIAALVQTATEAKTASDAATPAGVPAADRLPYRDATDTLTWTPSSQVVARALGWKIATDPVFGADPTGVADSTAALQACLDAAAADNTTCYAAGTFKTSGTLTVVCDLDWHRARINYTGVGLAMQLGDGAATLFRRTLSCPSLVCVSKPNPGWVGVEQSVGLKAVNTDTCTISFPLIAAFGVGLLMHGEARGNAYNNVFMGHLSNNKVNHDLTAAAGGWSNENLYIGGRFSHNSAEGTNVAGVRHIRIQKTDDLPNNNVWLKASVEGNIPEYHVECAGMDNAFLRCRWENGSTGCRIWWRAGAQRNEIDGGYTAHLIKETAESGALPQNVRSAVRDKRGVPTSGASDQLYHYMLDSTGLHLKQYSGAYDRLLLESATGRLWFGTGTAAPTRWLGGFGSTSVQLTGAHLVPDGPGTRDLGISGYRWRNVEATALILTSPDGVRRRVTVSNTGALEVTTA